MIAADLAFDQSLIKDLVRVGEALESVGRFQEAGTLYEEISSRFFKEFPPAGYNEASLHKFAALAFHRGGNFEDSERMYVKALHHDLARTGGSWATADERTKNLFADMIYMYRKWQKKDCNERGIREVDATVEGTLGILACVVGIDSDYINNEYKDFPMLLKPKYYKKKTAQRTLYLAVSNPVSVEKFRSTLLGCVGGNYENAMTRIHDPDEAITNRSLKSEARKLVASVHKTETTPDVNISAPTRHARDLRRKALSSTAPVKQSATSAKKNAK